MAKQVATRSQQVAPPVERNWAQEYGSEAFQSNIVGTLLKFNKGEWLAGKEEELIPMGSKFVAAVHILQSGWMRWEDNAPVQIIMGVRADGFRPPSRESLGYTDKSQWGEFNGQIRDPWQRTDLLLMADPKTGNIYTYSPMSDGGLSAIMKLCTEYGDHVAMHKDEIPIIELGSEWYKHPQYGKVHKPILKVIDWRDVGDVSFEPIEEEEEEQEKKAAPRRASSQKQAPAKRGNGRR